MIQVTGGDVILNRAKYYYKNNKERLRVQVRDKYRNLSEKKGEYGKNKYRNMSWRKEAKTKRISKKLSKKLPWYKKVSI